MNRLKDISKNIVIGTTSAIIILLVLEGILWVAGVKDTMDATILENPNDPQHRQLQIDGRYADQLPVSVMHNIVHNELTYPDEELIFKVKPNIEGGMVHGYSGINAQGFRGVDIDSLFDGKKIMLLGNSCVFGWDIKDVKKVFGSLLQENLLNLGENVRVYNMGQPGYSTTQLVELYDRWEGTIDPDILIIYAGWNDLWETPLLTDRQTMKLLELNHSQLLHWIKKSRIYSVMFRGLQALGVVASSEGIQTDGQGRGPRVPLGESLRNFESMGKTKAKIVIVEPPFCCVDRLQPMNFYVQKVRERIGSNATFVRLDSMLLDPSVSGRYFQEDGFHPNEIGHAYISKVLSETLEKWSKHSIGPTLEPKDAEVL